MKKFKETNELLYERSSQEKLALDLALLDEADGDMCSIPLDQLKSKVIRNRHEKMCGTSNNSIEEGPADNLVELIRDITSKMIGAIKKNDQRKLMGLYKNLGKVIK